MKGGKIITWKDKYNKKYGYDKGTSHSLKEIAKTTGIGIKGIQQIYNKGIGAYKTNPSSVRPSVKSAEQWAYGRVYSSVMGGNASKIDKNELKMEKGGKIYNAHILTDDNKMIHRRYPNKVTHNEIYNEYKDKGVEIKDSQIHFAKPIDFYDTLREETKKYVRENMNDGVDSKSIFISSMQKGNEYIATEIKGDTISGKAFTITPKDLFEITMKNNTKRNYEKGGRVKKFPISVQRRVEEINAMLPKVLQSDNYPSTYAGSTMESYVVLENPIEIKNQYVYINADKMRDNYPFEKRYNVNDRDDYSSNGRKALMYDLGIIKKAFTKLLKNDSLYAKGGKMTDKQLIKKEFDRLGLNERTEYVDVETEKNGNFRLYRTRVLDDKKYPKRKYYRDDKGDVYVIENKELFKSEYDDNMNELLTSFFMSKTKLNYGKYEKGGSTYAEGGVVYRHKYIPTMTFEIMGETQNGYKGIQKDKKSLSRLERTKGKSASYSSSELKDLFNKETFAKGGEITEVNQDGSNLPKPLYDLFTEMDLDRLGDYSYMEELREEANEMGYDFDYDLSGGITEFWEIDKMARGGSTYARGGEVIFTDLTDNTQSRKIWESRKSKNTGQNSFGSFAHRLNKKYIGDYYLYRLDDFDEKYYAHIPLKNGEILARVETDNMVGGEMPLVKININNGRVYFMSEDNDLNSDYDDKNPKFNRASADVIYLSLNNSIKEYEKYNKKLKGGSTYAKGGSLEAHALEIGDEILGFDFGEAYVINKGVVFIVDLKNGTRRKTKLSRQDAISTFAKGGMTNNFDSDFMDLVKG